MIDESSEHKSNLPIFHFVILSSVSAGHSCPSLVEYIVHSQIGIIELKKKKKITLHLIKLRIINHHIIESIWIYMPFFLECVIRSFVGYYVRKAQRIVWAKYLIKLRIMPIEIIHYS